MLGTDGAACADFGGVVPEIAARAHAERLDLAVEEALSRAGSGADGGERHRRDRGPGLIGGVLSGVMMARGLARGAGLPLIGVNHLAGHALTPRLTDGVAFPYLMLLVSGGHCQFLIVEGSDRFSPPWRHHRRRAGRGVRQDREASGLAATRWAGGRGRGARGRSRRGLHLPAPAAGPAGLRHVLFRPEDRRFCGPAMRWSPRRAGSPCRTARDLCAGFQAAVADVLVDKTGAGAWSICVGRGPTGPVSRLPGALRPISVIRAGLETVALPRTRRARSSRRRWRFAPTMRR